MSGVLAILSHLISLRSQRDQAEHYRQLAVRRKVYAMLNNWLGRSNA